MPEGYPTMAALDAAGWLPVRASGCPSAAWSPPAATTRWTASNVWWTGCGLGSELVDLGDVGHLNPASSHGPWPAAEERIAPVGAALRRPPPWRMPSASTAPAAPEVLTLSSGSGAEPGRGRRACATATAVNFIDVISAPAATAGAAPTVSKATPSASSRRWARASDFVKPGDRVGYLLLGPG